MGIGANHGVSFHLCISVVFLVQNLVVRSVSVSKLFICCLFCFIVFILTPCSKLRKECKDSKERVTNLEEQLVMASRQLNSAHEAKLKFQRDIEEVSCSYFHYHI